MKIYLASNLAVYRLDLAKLTEALQKAGHTVSDSTYGLHESLPQSVFGSQPYKWMESQEYRDAITSPVAIKEFRKRIATIAECDACVISVNDQAVGIDPPFLEAGFAVGIGKPVHFLINHTPISTALLGIMPLLSIIGRDWEQTGSICLTTTELIERLSKSHAAKPSFFGKFDRELPEGAVITPDSPDAARWGIRVGWTARDGHFWGDDEHMARWSGSTHRACNMDCGAIIPRSGDATCDACHEKAHWAIYRKAERAPWNGTDGLYDDESQRYFFDLESLLEYCEDTQTTPDKMRLYICKPNYASKYPLDGSHFEDILPSDDEGELPDPIQDAVDAFNKACADYDTPLSWEPSDVAAIVILPEGFTFGFENAEEEGK